VPVVQEAVAEDVVWAAVVVVVEVAVEEVVAAEVSDQPNEPEPNQEPPMFGRDIDSTTICLEREITGRNANNTISHVQHLREQEITKRHRQGQDTLCRIESGEWRKRRRLRRIRPTRVYPRL